MTKKRMRLGIGLDRQKLADTITQACDSFKQMPGLSIDTHTEDGWLHLFPKPGHDSEGKLTHVIGWLLTFGYPHDEEPGKLLTTRNVEMSGGVKLAAWEAGLYASYWLPPKMPSEEIADLAIALVQRVQAAPEEAHVEIALEFGL